MLNERDIEFMRESHKSIYDKRMKEVKIVYEKEEGEDVFGNPHVIKEEKIVKAVVTHLSALTNLDKFGSYGFVYEDGDIKIDVDEEYVPITLDLPSYFYIEGREYKVIYGKPKGIGVRNRMEFVGRRAS